VADKRDKAAQLNPPIVCLMGPTAAGKTAIALEIVDRFDCEIISVDSALIYRGMDIGTAKPDVDTLRAYPHHLVDIIDPIDTYSVANFRNHALRLIADIVARKKIPLLVGGSMLYFKALQGGLSLLPESSPSVRQRLKSDLDIHGSEYLHNNLAEIDPDAANRIHKNDPQRILRALEVWHITGVTLTEHHQRQTLVAAPFHPIKLCVTCDDRSILHRRIENRFSQMIESGFIEEVAELRSRYPQLSGELPSMRCVGYRQVWDYLDGNHRKNEMVEKGIAATRQLAKRQLTWLRGMEKVHWFDNAAGPQRALFSFLGSKLCSTN
jgi:tRNA dimethylallyltransferase